MLRSTRKLGLAGRTERFCCSVVISVSGNTDGLEKLLLSLSHQSWSAQNFEVIVCDDGSDQAIKPSISTFQQTIPHLRILRQDNRGLAAARNLGVIHSNSEIIIFLDCDVELDVHFIERMIRTLVNKPEWIGVAARISFRSQTAYSLERKPASKALEFDIAAIAYRSEALRDIGGLDETFRDSRLQGTDLSRRAESLGSIGFEPGAIAFCDRNDDSAAVRWASRTEWRYHLILAKRSTTTKTWQSKFPRLSTALAASFTGPVHAVKTLQNLGLTGLPTSLSIVIVDTISGLSMLPQILLEATPPQRAYIGTKQPKNQQVAVSKAS